jgi:hypothetical protein
MSHPPERHRPARYQFRIGEQLDAHWSTRFDDFILTRESDGTTTLTGLIQDQAQLHGILARIRDLSVTLIGMTVLETVDRDEGADDDPEGGYDVRSDITRAR